MDKEIKEGDNMSYRLESDKGNTFFKSIKTQQIIALYPIIPNKCLAEFYGLAESTIEGIANRYKIKKKPKEPYKSLPNNKIKRKEITNDVVQCLRDEGYTVKEICRILEISFNTYYRRRQGDKKFNSY